MKRTKKDRDGRTVQKSRELTADELKNVNGSGGPGSGGTGTGIVGPRPGE